MNIQSAAFKADDEQEKKEYNKADVESWRDGEKRGRERQKDRKRQGKAFDVFVKLFSAAALQPSGMHACPMP